MQKQSPDPVSEYRNTALDNGIRIVSERIPSHTVSLGVLVDVGSRDEHDLNNGYAHFAEHMFFKGTAARSPQQIAREFDVLGGTSNAFTTREVTCFHASVLDDKLPRLAELLSDIFLNSDFSQLELDRERQVILQEIGMVEDTPDDLVHDLFAAQIWKDHPLGNTVLGVKTVIEAVTSRSLKDFVKNHYTPEKILIAAAGNVDHDDLVSLFAENFSKMHGRPADFSRQAPPPAAPQKITVARPLEQEHIIVGVNCPSAVSEERYALLLLNTLLGGNMSSRLFQEVREKRGLAYSIYSYLATNVDSGYLGIYLGVDPMASQEAVSVVARELQTVTATEFSDDELADAKDYAKAALLLSADNIESRMLRLVRNEMLFNRYISLDEVVGFLEKVTKKEIATLWQRLFSKGRMTSVALGPLTDGEIDWEPLVNKL